MPEPLVTHETLADLKVKLELVEEKGIQADITCDLCLQLLALKFHFNDMVDAKFFWKRIQQAHKESNPELGKLWEVGKSIILRDTHNVHKLIEGSQWSDTIKHIMLLLQERVRERTLHLVSKAYTSLSLQELSKMLNLPTSRVTEIVTEKTWSVDKETDMVNVTALPSGLELSLEKECVSLASLTRLVSYLEN